MPATWAQDVETPLPTVDALTEAREAVRARTDIDEALKTRVTDLYQQAIDALKSIDTWSAKAAEFDLARTNAPKDLQDRRAELAAPLPATQVDIPPDAGLSQLELLLSQADADLRAKREAVTALDDERRRRTDRRAELPGAVAALKQTLEKLGQAPGESPVPEDAPELRRAKEVWLLARKRALQAEIKSAEAETASYEARGESLTARRDLAARQITQTEAKVKALQEVVNERRRVEAEQAARAAAAARREAAAARPEVRKIIEVNATWAERRTKERVPDGIEAATRKKEEIDKTLAGLDADFQSVSDKIKAAGLTHAMGLLLRRQGERLPSVRKHRDAVEARKAETSAALIGGIELKDERDELSERADVLVSEVLDSMSPSLTEDERQSVAATVRELLEARRGYIDALDRDYDTLLGKLADLDTAERELIRKLEAFRQYVDERILWVRSAPALSPSDWGNGVEALAWLTSPRTWTATLQGAGRSIMARPAWTVLGGLGSLVLLGGRHRVRRRIRELGALVSKSHSNAFTPTVQTLVLTLLLSATFPLPLWLLARACSRAAFEGEFTEAIGAGLTSVAFVYFAFECLRHICRPGGLGEAHFGWPGHSVVRLRRELTGFMLLGLPIAFVVAVIEWTGENAWQQSLGRIAFILAQMLMLVLVYRVLRPHGQVLKDILTSRTGGWLYRFRFVWYPLLLAGPVLLGLLAGFGFYYTALKLSSELWASGWLIFILVLANASALRWMLVARRKLALAKVRARRAAAESVDSVPLPPTSSLWSELSSISGQAQRVLHSFTALVLVVGLWVVWNDVLPALGFLENVEVWTVTEQVSGPAVEGAGGATVSAVQERAVPVTLADLALAVLLLVMAFVASANLPGLLEFTLLRTMSLQPGVQNAINSLCRYAVTILGVVLAFGAVGIGWSKVQWLVAAMTVGLGFGLQEIFANFVSGLIILFERPVRVGDTVTVGMETGQVTHIRIRATTLRDWNGKEVVVPNKAFVTGTVVNWSLSDRVVRQVIRVGIAYGSDVALARRILNEVVSKDPLVLEQPPPQVFFWEFADSSLVFEIRVFVRQLDDLAVARDSLHSAIDAAFREAKIEIAFPQRDIHIRSIPPAIPIADARTAAPAADH
jgi:potassium efflux system protein